LFIYKYIVPNSTSTGHNIIYIYIYITIIKTKNMVL